MSELIYIPVDGQVRIINEDGDTEFLTCVEQDGCLACEFKRDPGKPQHAFCQAVACGEFERPDGKSVIFQHIKVKGGEQ